PHAGGLAVRAPDLHARLRPSALGALAAVRLRGVPRGAGRAGAGPAGARCAGHEGVPRIEPEGGPAGAHDTDRRSAAPAAAVTTAATVAAGAARGAVASIV